MRATEQKFSRARPAGATSRQSTRSGSSHANDMQVLTDYYAPIVSQNPAKIIVGTLGKNPSKMFQFTCAGEASQMY